MKGLLFEGAGSRLHGLIHARCFLLSVIAFLALVTAISTVYAQAPKEVPQVQSQVPPPYCDPATDREVIVVPPDWRSLYPFSKRFAPERKGRASAHIIDLNATRFQTDGLVGVDSRGRRMFKEPDLSSFVGTLRRKPFTYGSQDYFIVQAGSPQDQVMLRGWMKRNGVRIMAYIPDYAYLVLLSEEKYKKVKALPEVFWAGQYSPAFRLDSKLDYVIEASPYHQVKIRAVFDRAAYSSFEELQNELASVNATVWDIIPSPTGWIARLEGAASTGRALASLRGCLWVERYVERELFNNIARTSSNVTTGRGAQSGPIMDVEDVWARGIRGEGQIASAADTGLSTGDLATLHKDFGDQSDASNPMRVLKGYALGRSTWDDDQSIGGGHGTHTSGSIVGNGFRSGSTPSTNTFPGTCYAGTAPKADFVFQSVMDSRGALGGLPSDLNTLFLPPYNDGARVHSNSWGAPVAGDYNTDAQSVDEFMWNHKDMVITFSAGNEGTDTSPKDGVVDTNSIGSPGTAKNCITVGASENYRPDFVYEYPEGDCTGDGYTQQAWGWAWSTDFSADPIKTDLMADDAGGLAAFSSRGPTSDGRFKPDIVAPGIAIISTRTDVNQAYEQWGVCSIPTALQSYYMTMGGTSMANPLTAGTAVLVRQYYVDGWHPNNSQTTNGSANAADGFDPSSALVKATLINGAWDMAPGQYGTGGAQEIPPGWDAGHDLPNNAEGYGRVDLEHSLFPGSGWGDDSGRKMGVHDITPGLQTGQSDVRTFSVTSSANPLIVTLVWTDPYGSTTAGQALVNDLDLTVTAPGGAVYYPNGLNKLSGADHVNNVEQVKVTAPSNGIWTVAVAGTSVPGNGQTGTATQPYALVVSGVIAPPCTAPGTPSGLALNVPGDNEIDLTWAAGSPAGSTYNVYRTTGSCPGTGYSLLASDLTSLAYSDTTVSGGTTYAYVVTAVDSTGGCESARSGCASETATGACTAAPAFAGLTSVTNPASATCELDLAWSAATPNCGSSVYYNVYRSTAASFTPSASNRIATGVVGTAYADSAGLTFNVPYYYVVRAVDASNGAEEVNTDIQSGVATGPGTATQTLFSSDFESGSGTDGWEIGTFNSGATSDWRGIKTCTAHSGTHIYRFGGNNCTNNYANGDYCFAAPGGSSGISIPAGATSVRLAFWHKWQFENGYDGALLYISTDNANFSYVPASAFVSGGYNGDIGAAAWTGTSSGYSSSFQEVVVDLDAAADAIGGNTGGAAGKTLWIAFTGYSDNYIAADGWFIDDVAVTAQILGTCATGASPGSVRPVPDGKWVSGTPMQAVKTSADGSSVDLTWDVASCQNVDYSVYYGNGSEVSSYSLSGSQCGLGNSGSASWSAPAIPSGEHFIWWVIAGTDGVQTESSWGKDSAGNERHPTASNQCGMTAKSTATSCP